MRNLLPVVERWFSEGKSVALATVVKVYGSAPQPLGAKMVVSDQGEMAGSVSGGCVESAVVQEALEVLSSGEPRLIPFGISDDVAWSVGLACGGTIEVFVERLHQNAIFQAWADALKAHRLATLATILNGTRAGQKVLILSQGRIATSLEDDSLLSTLVEQVTTVVSSYQPARLTVHTTDETLDIFVDVFPPPPKIIVVGAVHIAIPLVTFARELGFRTYVVDARTAFATRERFPHADDLVIGWPEDVLPRLGLDENTYVVVLSHDEKLDNPALKVALEHPVRYVGALGSRKTHARRVAALRKMGVSEDAIARIHAPIGLDIGARRPEEIAVSIIAEIVSVHNGHTDSTRRQI